MDAIIGIVIAAAVAGAVVVGALIRVLLRKKKFADTKATGEPKSNETKTGENDDGIEVVEASKNEFRLTPKTINQR